MSPASGRWLTTLNSPCVGEVRIFRTSEHLARVVAVRSVRRCLPSALATARSWSWTDQMQAQAEFLIWTKTPAATHFSGSS